MEFDMSDAIEDICAELVYMTEAVVMSFCNSG